MRYVGNHRYVESPHDMLNLSAVNIVANRFSINVPAQKFSSMRPLLECPPVFFVHLLRHLINGCMTVAAPLPMSVDSRSFIGRVFVPACLWRKFPLVYPRCRCDISAHCTSFPDVQGVRDLPAKCNASSNAWCCCYWISQSLVFAFALLLGKAGRMIRVSPSV